MAKATKKTAAKTGAKKTEAVKMEENRDLQAAPESAVGQAAPEKSQTSAEQGTDAQSLKALVTELQRQLAEQHPQVVQVMADTEKVTLRFQSECAEDNLALFGPAGMYGQVTGKSGTILVPKAEWSRFMTEQVRYMLDNRTLIVLNGLGEEELELYGCNYREGELLDRAAFMKLLDLGRDLIAIFPALCTPHREMIAKRFLSAYESGDERAQDRELIVALNEFSKESCGGFSSEDPRRNGLFAPIIERMNEKDLQ